MSTQTPSAPSAPVAAALSPVLWQVQIDLISTHLLMNGWIGLCVLLTGQIKKVI